MWEELSKIALLGTGHSAIPEHVLEALRSQGVDTGKEEPLLLLEAAAMYHQYRKAGFRLKTFKGKLPESVEDAGEPSCSSRSAHHLKLILNGQFAAVFPEFIHYLNESGKLLPVEQLPALLNLPDIRGWWPLLEGALGVRGRWLLRQHPEWSRLLPGRESGDWQLGNREERLRLLHALRLTNPSDAVALLESTWDEESYKDKAVFLQALETGLSTDDEPLLEKAKADSRKEVRQVAWKLLPKIPGSAFSERMFDRAVKCLDFRNGTLKVVVPDSPDGEAANDGILPLHPEWKGGTQAGYLGQVFARVPPLRWEKWFDRKEEEVLRLIAGTQWAETILQAIAEAAVFFEDEKWTGVLLAYWFDKEDTPLWNTRMGAELLERAPASSVNRLSTQYLDDHPGLPADNSPVYQLLLRNAAPWDDELTKAIISRLQIWLSNTKRQDWQSYHYKEFLKMVAIRCNPDLLDFLQKGWRTEFALWAFWERPVEDMLNTIRFRREMIRELTG